MDDEKVFQFINFTESTPNKARQYLSISDGNIEQAVELFFNTGGIDLEEPSAPHTQSSQATPISVTHPQTPVRRQLQSGDGDMVDLISDEETLDDDDPEMTVLGASTSTLTGTSSSRTQARGGDLIAQPIGRGNDDESMARRLQEEFYAGADLNGSSDTGGYRAPIARTRETLVGPESYDMTDSDELRQAVAEQVRARNRSRNQAGIFNQQPGSNSIWSSEDNNARHGPLSRATAGTSDASSKSTLLAEMYRPPFEIMSRLSWERARSEGKDNEKWILVNVQDPAVFDCQVLNRDLWKNPGIKETIQENFIFMQYSKDDQRGSQYMQYYFQARDNQEAYPHIAIVDPRTGEQVKVWSGPPSPKPMDFLMQIHEFLDRYSLNAAAKNPIARRKPEPKKERQVEKMTEEEMLEMALQNSLAGTAGAREGDPDDLTRSTGDFTKGQEHFTQEDVRIVEADFAERNGFSDLPNPSLFKSISSVRPHIEPPANMPSTRIQFRHPTGRLVRRFLLTDSVRRIYEWLKASPLETREGMEFGLVSMQKNLIELLDETVQQAGLQNGTVMIEYVDTN